MLTVIIPTCNRNDLLAKCLDCLYEASKELPAQSYEVIVTDDSKENIANSLILTHYNWVTWIEGPKVGPAANRNNAAKQAKGEWLIFLDDDCLPQKNWLTAYWNSIKITPGATVFEGKTTADRDKERYDEEAPINLSGGKLWSCNFAIKTEIFERLNGFDETFPFAAMEDVDFYTRVVSLATITFVPDALVIHPWRQIKPFKSFQKHLKSHRHFAKKYDLLNLKFRLVRFKIFIASIFINFKELSRFSMRGWKAYLEMCLLNFCLIFI